MTYVVAPRRRYYKRYKVDGFVTLVDSAAQKHLFVLRDLSSRGMGIASNALVNIKDVVKVIVDYVPGFNISISQNARIIWCEKTDDKFWRAGLDFGMAHLVELE